MRSREEHRGIDGNGPVANGARRRTAPWVSPSVRARPPWARDAVSERHVAAAAPVVRIVEPIEEPPTLALPARGAPGDEALETRATNPEPLLIEAPPLIRVHDLERFAPDPALWLMTRPGSPMAEQYRVLALKLKEVPGLRVVGMAGPAAESDGALAAANLALALGEGTRSRVLLIDADMRRPRLGDLFGVADSPGLSEQVRRHRREPREPWEVSGLSGTVSLLTAGSTEKNPSGLLSSEGLGDLIQEARRAFDYIIVAAPPVLQSADASLLQDHLDGALLVVQLGITRQHSVKAAVERLGSHHLVGTVTVQA